MLPLAAIIGAEPEALHCRADVMTYDADSTVPLQRELRRQLRGYAASQRSASYCEQIVPRTEMVSARGISISSATEHVKSQRATNKLALV